MPRRRNGGVTPAPHLLDGEAWANSKETVLTALSLPADSDELLAGHARVLDDAYRDFVAGLEANTAVRIDDGRLQVERLTAIPDAPSLVERRKGVGAMPPASTCPR